MMPALRQLHRAARQIFNHALNAVDAREAVRRAVTLEAERLRICHSSLEISSRHIYGVAIGKAAPAMAAGLSEALGPRIMGGVISSPAWAPSGFVDTGKWQTFEGGHPLPNEQSLAAAQAVFDLIERADEERALVVFLISGGGSTMLEWPRSPDITLAELQETNRQLVSCGASIAEVNTVRRTFSAVKAGGLAKRVRDAEQITLIVSDTNPGEEANVASGPTLTPLTGSQTASEIVRLYGLGAFLPRSILRSIEQDERSLPPAVASGFHLSHPHCVLLDNHTATEAAASKARELGFVTEVADDIREQPIAEGCNLLLNRLDELHERADKEQAICLISGGEFSCPTRGDGVGGRNQETVLRCAINLHESKQTSTRVVLSAGTDGIDGNSPAAGAIADKTTISRAAAAGLDARNFLDRSDSFTFLDTLGDAIFTGATGTNVRDIRILLASPSY